jgi:hypothetical protein
MKYKYRILHIPTGSFVRLFIDRRPHQRKITHISSIANLRTAFSDYDFIVQSIISDTTDNLSDEGYWESFRQVDYFTNRQCAEDVISELFDYVELHSSNNYIVLNSKIVRDEFEIIRE